MEDKNIYDKIFDDFCEVCGTPMKKDIYKQGKCPNCGWKNHYTNEEHPDSVSCSNLVSLNKAKQLYSQGKPFEPNLDEFIETLSSYGEMQFEYNGVCYAVEVANFNGEDSRVSLYNSQTKEEVFFEGYDDFKNNAKVEEKFLKDIWDKTTDRYFLQ